MWVRKTMKCIISVFVFVCMFSMFVDSQAQGVLTGEETDVDKYLIPQQGSESGGGMGDLRRGETSADYSERLMRKAKEEARKADEWYENFSDSNRDKRYGEQSSGDTEY